MNIWRRSLVRWNSTAVPAVETAVETVVKPKSPIEAYVEKLQKQEQESKKEEKKQGKPVNLAHLPTRNLAMNTILKNSEEMFPNNFNNLLTKYGWYSIPSKYFGRYNTSRILVEKAIEKKLKELGKEELIITEEETIDKDPNLFFKNPFPKELINKLQVEVVAPWYRDVDVRILDLESDKERRLRLKRIAKAEEEALELGKTSTKETVSKVLQEIEQENEAIYETVRETIQQSCQTLNIAFVDLLPEGANVLNKDEVNPVKIYVDVSYEKAIELLSNYTYDDVIPFLVFFQTRVNNEHKRPGTQIKSSYNTIPKKARDEYLYFVTRLLTSGVSYSLLRHNANLYNSSVGWKVTPKSTLNIPSPVDRSSPLEQDK